MGKGKIFRKNKKQFLSISSHLFYLIFGVGSFDYVGKKFSLGYFPKKNQKKFLAHVRSLFSLQKNPQIAHQNFEMAFVKGDIVCSLFRHYLNKIAFVEQYIENMIGSTGFASVFRKRSICATRRAENPSLTYFFNF